tara:strand:- start:184 stop:369 length:186 start_codon:yes stop_codon:yes gene_type:complete
VVEVPEREIIHGMKATALVITVEMELFIHVSEILLLCRPEVLEAVVVMVESEEDGQIVILQ